MKSKLMIVLVVGLISVEALGCANAKEDIVVKEDVTVEVAKKEKKLISEKIDNSNNYELGTLLSKNNEFYGIESLQTIGNLSCEVNTLYKITQDNKIEKIKNENAGYIAASESMKAGLVFDIIDGVQINGIRYHNGIDGKSEKLFEFEETFKIEHEQSIRPKVKIVNEEYGFYTVFNCEGDDIFSGDKSLNKVEELEIFNIKTKERKKVKNTLKSEVVDVFYDKGFYVLTDEAKLYKLKENNKNFTIDSEIDLSEMTGVKEGKSLAVENAVKEGDELVIQGAKEIEAVKGDREEERKMKMVMTMQSFIIKYNLKTKEKTYVSLKENESIIDIKNNIVLFAKDFYKEESMDREFYVGEVIDGKIKTIGQIDLDKKQGEHISIIFNSFNEMADEILLSILKTTGAQSVDSDTVEYLRVKIE
ncbi:MAG: hypothetical protein ACRCWG_04545 [Sarcina sp.]